MFESKNKLRLERFADEVRKGFADLNRGIDELRSHLSRIHKRRDLGATTKRKHLAVLHRTGGMCPCCREVRIVDALSLKLPLLQWDHWKAPGCNGLKATWPVCATCNSKLEDPLFKSRKQTSFAAYQDVLLGPDGAPVQRSLFDVQ